MAATKAPRTVKARIDFSVDAKAAERARAVFEHLCARMPGIAIREPDVWRACFLRGLTAYETEHGLAPAREPEKRRRVKPTRK